MKTPAIFTVFLTICATLTLSAPFSTNGLSAAPIEVLAVRQPLPEVEQRTCFPDCIKREAEPEIEVKARTCGRNGCLKRDAEPETEVKARTCGRFGCPKRDPDALPIAKPQ